MGKTLAEKILARCSGVGEVKAGEIITCKVDCAMLDDTLGPLYVDPPLKRLGGKIWDKSKVVLILDHYAPSGSIAQANVVSFARKWAEDNDIENYFEECGPCHQILAENCYDLPGTLLVGVDSHTVTAGAFGCFGTGIGSTEMAAVLNTGEIWLRVPESMLIRWDGEINKRVMAKDMILRTIKDIGHSGATYMAMEFSGSTIRSLPMDERMCITNMSVEAGAKAGLIECDDITEKYLKDRGNNKPYYKLKSDPDADYVRIFNYRAEDLIPQVACPHEVDNVKDITDVAGTPINRSYIGSCTGGRLTDLIAAAEILKGKKLVESANLLYRLVQRQYGKPLQKWGYLIPFLKQVRRSKPICGACVGYHSG